MHDRNDIFLINWRAVASLSPNHRAVCVFSMYYHRKSAHIFCNSISSDKTDFRVITWITRWNYWNLNIYRWWHGIGRWCFCVECSYSIIKSKNDFPTKRLIDHADAKKNWYKNPHSNDNLTVYPCQAIVPRACTWLVFLDESVLNIVDVKSKTNLKKNTAITCYYQYLSKIYSC